MKPAPPVTRRLRRMNLSQHPPQVDPPMRGSHAERPRRVRGVQHTEGWPLCRAWKVAAGDRVDWNASGQQTQGETLLLDREGEVIPAGNPGIRPVVDAEQVGPACRRPERVGPARGPRPAARLVGFDAGRSRRRRSMVRTKLSPRAAYTQEVRTINAEPPARAWTASSPARLLAP